MAMMHDQHIDIYLTNYFIALIAACSAGSVLTTRHGMRVRSLSPWHMTQNSQHCIVNPLPLWCLQLEAPYSWVVDGAEFYGNNKSRCAAAAATPWQLFIMARWQPVRTGGPGHVCCAESVPHRPALSTLLTLADGGITTAAPWAGQLSGPLHSPLASWQALRCANMPVPTAFAVEQGSSPDGVVYLKSALLSRVVNIYLISTAGVGPEDIDRCLQCPCDDDPDRGGFACCKECKTQTPGPPRSYWFEYNVTYRCNSCWFEYNVTYRCGSCWFEYSVTYRCVTGHLAQCDCRSGARLEPAYFTSR